MWEQLKAHLKNCIAIYTNKRTNLNVKFQAILIEDESILAQMERIESARIKKENKNVKN